MRMMRLAGIFSRAMVAGILCGLVACSAGTRTPPVEVKVSQFHMGMMVDLVVWSPSTEEGRAACGKAFERIRELNLVFSDYEPESELSRFSHQAGCGPVKVSPELFTVLQLAKEMSVLSNGRYDVTAAPVIRLWRQAPAGPETAGSRSDGPGAGIDRA